MNCYSRGLTYREITKVLGSPLSQRGIQRNNSKSPNPPPQWWGQIDPNGEPVSLRGGALIRAEGGPEVRGSAAWARRPPEGSLLFVSSLTGRWAGHLGWGTQAGALYGLSDRLPETPGRPREVRKLCPYQCLHHYRHQAAQEARWCPQQLCREPHGSTEDRS